MPRNRSDHGQQRPGLLRVRQRRRVLQVNKQTTNVITTTKKARERDSKCRKVSKGVHLAIIEGSWRERIQSNIIRAFFTKIVSISTCFVYLHHRAGVGGRDLQGDHGGHRLHVLLTDF